jgi:hypothetical protein
MTKKLKMKSLYSSCFKITKTRHSNAILQNGCSKTERTVHTGDGLKFLKINAIVCAVSLTILLCGLFLTCCPVIADTAQPAEDTKATANKETDNKADNKSENKSDNKTDKKSDTKSDNNTTDKKEDNKVVKTAENIVDSARSAVVADNFKSANNTKNNTNTKTDKNTTSDNIDTKNKTNKTEPIDNGWTAIVPNKEKEKNEKSETDQEIRIAEQKTGTQKDSSNNNDGKIGIWDALPKNVTDGETSSPNKPQQSQSLKTKSDSNSPFATPKNIKEPTTTIPELNPDPTPTPQLPLTIEPIIPAPPVNLSPAVLPNELESELHEPSPITAKIGTGESDKNNSSQDNNDGEIKEPGKSLVKPKIDSEDGNNTGSTENNTQNTPKIETPNEAAPKTETNSLVRVPNRSAEEIEKRLNALAQEKSSLEQMLKNTADEKNDDDKGTTDSDESFGVSRSGAAKTPDETKSEETQENKTDTENQPQEPAEKTETTDATKGDQENVDSEETNVVTEEVLGDFDELTTDEPVKKLIDPSRVGDPDGVAKIKLMYDEVINGLKSRNIAGKYERWKEYARTTLRNSAGINTGSELDGRTRLSWYKKLYNEPIYSVFEAEEFTRRLHDGLSGNHRLIAESMAIIREKLDVPARNDSGIIFPKCETPIDAISEVKRALISAQMHHARAVSTLTSAEQTELVGNLVQTFVGQGCVNGHTIPSRTYGRRLLDMLEKVDKSAMHDAAEAFIPLLNTSLLELLDKLPEDALPSTLIGGQKFQRLTTAAGDIIIGGRGNNAYDLDSPDFRDVICIIDLGGNDSYRDGTCGLHRPVLLIIDLHGNDTYTATRAGVQGGSILGVSVLIDVEGDDRYNAVDVAQGSSIGGIGLLFDFGGDDSYRALRRAQAHALSGVGMIIDREGNDSYHAAMWAQAFGAPGGFGVLEDTSGDDHYYCGGLYIDSYPEHPGYDGWGQGIGAGIRQVANGGIGVLLEGSGNDVYEVDYFGHGGGYWLGVGFARDFGGNDVRHGTTLTAYNGTARRENKWTRFANGFGCHYSVGYCFDDSGDDVYGGTIMGTGMAWDLSMGYLCDFNGNDKFTATGGMTQGVGAEGSIGILFSYGGNDTFSGRNQAYASGNITYHSTANCGSNFSFVINYGGTDSYGSGAKNNSYVQRGSTGGFLIDRPTSSEAVVELANLQKAIDLRNEEIKAYDEKQAALRKEAAEKGRRYYPRTRRPVPIPSEQQRILSGVPDFGKPVPTSVSSAENNDTVIE